MSHCCGGCGGEDPSKKKPEALEKDVNDTTEKKSAAEKAETNTSPTGTWQPEKK